MCVIALIDNVVCCALIRLCTITQATGRSINGTVDKYEIKLIRLHSRYHSAQCKCDMFFFLAIAFIYNVFAIHGVQLTQNENNRPSCDYCAPYFWSDDSCTRI